MAKLEYGLTGDFDEILARVDSGILSGSMSASYEGGSDYSSGGVRCAVRVYERFSMIGGNRVSLNVTPIGSGGDLFVSAIASGGSQAVLFKMNTFGEESFLQCVADILEPYRDAREV